MQRQWCNNMENANYILHTYEVAWMPKKEQSVLMKMKPVVLALIGIILILSIVFKDFLFTELNWGVRIILIILCIKTMTVSKDEEVPSPIDLIFYNDRIVLYRDHHYHSKKVQRREWYTVYYKDIRECILRTHVNKLCITGAHDTLCFNYHKDGTLSDKPDFSKHVEDGICYFYTKFCTDIDLVSEIETHSPIKVIVNDT